MVFINFPDIVGYKLCPIYELLPTGSGRDLLETATREYIRNNSPYDEILKTLESKKVVYMIIVQKL